MIIGYYGALHNYFTSQEPPNHFESFGGCRTTYIYIVVVCAQSYLVTCAASIDYSHDWVAVHRSHMHQMSVFATWLSLFAPYRIQTIHLPGWMAIAFAVSPATMIVVDFDLASAVQRCSCWVRQRPNCCRHRHCHQQRYLSPRHRTMESAWRPACRSLRGIDHVCHIHCRLGHRRCETIWMEQGGWIYISQSWIIIKYVPSSYDARPVSSNKNEITKNQNKVRNKTRTHNIHSIFRIIIFMFFYWHFLPWQIIMELKIVIK